MAKFDFNAYISREPKSVKWLSENEFEIVVDTKRQYYADIMDMAGQKVLKKVKFHLLKNEGVCWTTSTKNERLYLSDEEELKLNIILNNIGTFFQNHEFSPEAFCSFTRYLMRPQSKVDNVRAKRK